MGKWLLDKVGIKGAQWIYRGIAAAMLGAAGWACWTSGNIDGAVETIDRVTKELDNKVD